MPQDWREDDKPTTCEAFTLVGAATGTSGLRTAISGR